MNKNHLFLLSATTIADVRLTELQAIFEPRGNLVIGETSKQIPFLPKRFFVVSDVPAQESRSHHAHRAQHQFLIALQGACFLLIDDGKTTQELTLDRPNLGVYIPPQIWTQYLSSPDAILLVLASDLYDPSDYLRDYDEFVRLKWGDC